MLECCRDNPARLPDWRWRRAMGIVDGTQPGTTRRRDGPIGYRWIKKAVAFRRSMQCAHDDMARLRVADEYPDIFWAHHVWENYETAIKDQIEAYILARQDDWAIGFKCRMSPEQVQAYECLFFDVRDELDHSAYIVHSVIGPALQRSLSDRDFAVLWKLYAYYYGPHAVDALVSKMSNPLWCSTPDTIGTAFQEDAIGTMKMKAALAAKTVPVSFSTQVDLLHIFTKFVEVERTTDSAGKAQDQMLEHITAMMINLPFAIDNRNPREGGQLVDAGPTGVFEATAVELSYEETMAVATGHQLRNADMLRRMKYPPLPAPDDGNHAGGNA